MGRVIGRVRRVQDAQPMREGQPPYWIGQTQLYPVADALGTDQLVFNVVFHEAGARTTPHLHSHDQIIYQLSGVGIVALDGGEDERVETEEFILLPAFVPHMHGAAEDGPAVLLTVLRSEFTVDFTCPIPDAWLRYRI